MELERVSDPWYDGLIETSDHILIAGKTGSGKSAIMNALLNSILCSSPDKHSVVLIDPKIVEFDPYIGLDYCAMHAEHYEDIVKTLQTCYNLIKLRYDSLKGTRVRTYQGTKLHIFIDELADIMLNKDRRAATLLQQIIQIARAGNVQLICATQNPLSSVIPTGFKINCGIIIGLQTRNARDSRNILDEPGCERLPRHGKALVKDSDHQDLQLVDVPLIPWEYTQRLIDYRMSGN